jgi:hypothetical protein
MSREIKKILISTMPRSGTTFFFDFISKLFDFEKVEPKFADGLVPEAPEWDPYKFDKTYLEMKDNQVLCAHYQFNDDIVPIINDENTLTFFLYRDPRDADLSATLYIKNALTHHALHHTLSNMSESDAIALMISGGLIKTVDGEYIRYEGIIYKTTNTIKWISTKNVCAIRYEDFFTKPFETMKKALEKSGVDIEDIYLKQILSEFSFAKFSNGRKQGEEDKTSHFRKGIIGDYENNYKEIHKAISKIFIGKDLITLGYERDLKW